MEILERNKDLLILQFCVIKYCKMMPKQGKEI